MANKSITQLPTLPSRISDDDLIQVVRSGVNYKMSGRDLPPAWITGVAVLTSTQILALGTTPVEILPAPAAGKAILPVRFLVELFDGTADYATNTELIFGPTGALTDSLYGQITSIADRTKATATASADYGGYDEGAGVSVKVRTGNPTSGDSDMRITIWYHVIDIP